MSASRRLADYYPTFRRRSIILLMLIQTIGAVLVVAVGLIMLSLGAPVLAVAGGLVTIILCFEIALSPLIVDILSEPTKLVATAITQLSNQGDNMPAPDLSNPRYEGSGLKLLVQTIYDLALPAPGSKKKGNINNALSSRLLNDAPAGIIGLNAAHQVIYANAAAPARLNPAQQQEIQLMFPEDSFMRWLRDCEKNKVRDLKFWSDIASALPETEGRKIYDVLAFYQKGSNSAETIIVTLDRTTHYAPVEEDIDFIALAAHELRGPITVIRGYLDVLTQELNPKLLPEELELINRLQVSSNRLSGYINNILNVSRYDRRHLRLHLSEDRLGDIINSISDDLIMRAQTSGRLLSVDLPADLPTIAADRNSLSEVIINLVDNAIKYSNEGGQVILAAGVKGNFVEITVQDFGIGIPASVIGHLFSKFYRSHRSRQAVSGTGLGLYITKAIVESHGGQVFVRSTEGQGSTFGFTVPIYSTVADKLAKDNNGNEAIIESSNGWIKNHAMFRR